MTSDVMQGARFPDGARRRATLLGGGGEVGQQGRPQVSVAAAACPLPSTSLVPVLRPVVRLQRTLHGWPLARTRTTLVMRQKAAQSRGGPCLVPSWRRIYLAVSLVQERWLCLPATPRRRH